MMIWTRAFLVAAVLIAGAVAPSQGQDVGGDLVRADSRVAGATRLSTGILAGYNSGFGIQGLAVAHQPAEGFPFDVRLGLAWTAVEPGDAAAARRIFINNATNGTPEEHGRTLDVALDVLRPMQLFSFERSWWFLGLRYSRFKGNFRYIGGNEDFDVKSAHWGLGGGVESHFRLSRKLDLATQAGFDYLRPNRLVGHDTSYGPDGETVNRREDFTYADADEAIGQPKYRPRFQVGFVYHHERARR